MSKSAAATPSISTTRPPSIFDPGLRIVRAGEGRKAVLGVLDGELVEPQRALVPVGEALPAVGAHVCLSTAGLLGFISGMSFFVGIPTMMGRPELPLGDLPPPPVAYHGSTVTCLEYEPNGRDQVCIDVADTRPETAR